MNWNFENSLELLMELLGGLGFFLLGMKMLSDSMKKLAGKQMRHFLGTLSENRFTASAFGVFFTILFQSSSAATVVLIGFVEAGLLVFAQTLPVILGTALGTTITAQLVAFKIGRYALLGVGIGFIMSMITKGKWKYTFETLLSLGILFFGMELMSNSMKPLESYEPFVNLIIKFRNPVFALITGMIFTALIQSSAAFIGVLISIGSTGLLNPEVCLPMILGSNIGTTITGFLSSLNAGRPAKKVAYANTFFKLITAVLFMFVLPYWNDVTNWFTGREDQHFGRYIANAHTLFNLTLLLFWLPFTQKTGSLFDKFLPDSKDAFSLKYLNDNVLDAPVLSVALLKKELLEMGTIVLTMVEKTINIFLTKDRNSLSELKEMEKDTDKYREKINDFWLRSAQVSSNDEWPDELYELLHLVNELEQIADLISVNVYNQAEKWIELDADFSDEGKKELLYYHSRCVKQLKRALKLVENKDYNRALKMKEKYRKYAYQAFNLEISHYKRLFTKESQSVASSKIHLELLNLYRIINSRATNFGRIILMEGKTNELQSLVDNI